MLCDAEIRSGVDDKALNELQRPLRTTKVAAGMLHSYQITSRVSDEMLSLLTEHPRSYFAYFASCIRFCKVVYPRYWPVVEGAPSLFGSALIDDRLASRHRRSSTRIEALTTMDHTDSPRPACSITRFHPHTKSSHKWLSELQSRSKHRYHRWSTQSRAHHSASPSHTVV